MAVERLFENLVIDWRRLTVPDIGTRRESPRHQADVPALESLGPEHLTSTAALRTAYRASVARGLLADSEANFLAFLSTAAYCERVGERPAALFLHLVRAGRFPSTLEDEDRAIAALKRLLSAEGAARRWLKPAGRPTASDAGGIGPAPGDRPQSPGPDAGLAQGQGSGERGGDVTAGDTRRGACDVTP